MVAFLLLWYRTVALKARCRGIWLVSTTCRITYAEALDAFGNLRVPPKFGALVYLAGLAAFLPPGFWDALRKRRRKVRADPPPPPRAALSSIYTFVFY